MIAIPKIKSKCGIGIRHDNDAVEARGREIAEVEEAIDIRIASIGYVSATAHVSQRVVLGAIAGGSCMPDIPKSVGVVSVGG